MKEQHLLFHSLIRAMPRHFPTNNFVRFDLELYPLNKQKGEDYDKLSQQKILPFKGMELCQSGFIFYHDMLSESLELFR